MFGAILGDIIGSPYEFGLGEKSKDFPLVTNRSHFTDDTVMTVAIGWSLMHSSQNYMNDWDIKRWFIYSIKLWYSFYPNLDYGGNFLGWLNESEPQPYNSCGNGSAMRVSSIGWFFSTLDETRRIARLSARISHNHPEGIKGAEAVVSCIYMLRAGDTKSAIKSYIEKEFGYNLDFSLDDIRSSFQHNETCQYTVPPAIVAFLESNDFEDAIRNAISLGGDADTVGAITASIAEAYYGIPDYMMDILWSKIDKPIAMTLRDFQRYKHKYID